MRRRNPRTYAGALALCALAGCATLEKQVYVASDTSLGVNGAVNTAQSAGKLVIGYDRKFVALVPKKTPDANSDVMSTYNCTQVKVQGLRIAGFSERLATGDAATALMQNDQHPRCPKPAAE